MVNRSRQGKRITGGHTTLIERLDEFLIQLEQWPEVSTIHTRHLTKTRRSSRSGGLNFRATRWEFIGNRTAGIRCIATAGSSNQVVILTSSDLEKLKFR